MIETVVFSHRSQNGRDGIDIIAAGLERRQHGSDQLRWAGYRGERLGRTDGVTVVHLVPDAGYATIVAYAGNPVETLTGELTLLAESWINRIQDVYAFTVAAGAVWREWGYKARSSAVHTFDGERVRALTPAETLAVRSAANVGGEA